MSCFGCSKRYGIFCKEHGCPNCGYSYCAKCLKRPIAVPKHGDKVENVCLICFDKLSKLQANERVIDCEALPGTIVTKATKGTKNTTQEDVLFENNPPANLDEVLAPTSLKSTSIDATISTTTQNANDEIVENLDRIISKRLKDLKSVGNLPTDDDFRSRLADLKDMPNKDYSKKDILLSTDERTDQQKMNDLLEQFMGETQLDKQVDQHRTDAMSDIERRLRALRDTPVDGTNAKPNNVSATSLETNTPSDNEQDEETMLKTIMQKYLEEARLPVASNELENELLSSIPKPPAGAGAAANSEELPWCNICNENAVIRCKGCDGELFCAQCFRECHDDDEEYRLHEKESYSAPPKFKEDHF